MRGKDSLTIKPTLTAGETTRENLRQLPAGSRPVFDGHLVRWGSERRAGGVTNIGGVVIRLADGHLIPVFYEYNFSFCSGGELENLSGKKPEVGDLLRLCCRVRNDNQLQVSRVFLAEPCARRIAAYKRLRRIVKILLRRQESYVLRGQFSKARRLHTAICRMELTKKEREQNHMLLDKIPDDLWPLAACHRPSMGFEIGFKDFNHLTKVQFKVLALGILAGTIKQARQGTNFTAMVHYLMLPPFSDEERLAIFDQALRQRVMNLREGFAESNRIASLINHDYVRFCHGFDKSLIWLVAYCLENASLAPRWVGSNDLSFVFDSAVQVLRGLAKAGQARTLTLRLVEDWEGTLTIGGAEHTSHLRLIKDLKAIVASASQK